MGWFSDVLKLSPAVRMLGLGGKDDDGGGATQLSKYITDNPKAMRDFVKMLTSYSNIAGEPMKEAYLQDVDLEKAIADATIQANMDLSTKYGPEYNQMVIDLERQMAPEYSALQGEQFGRDIEMTNKFAPSLRAAVEDPRTTAIRTALSSAIMGDLSLGSSLSPDMQREIEQSIRSGQSARGMIRGNAPVAAEAFAKGSAGQALKTQRQKAASDFLTQSASLDIDPFKALTGRESYRSSTPYSANIQGQSGVQGIGQTGMQLTQQQAAWEELNRMLQFNQDAVNQANKPNWGKLIGTGLGGLAGFGLGGPYGAMMGAGIGGNIGGSF